MCAEFLLRQGHQQAVAIAIANGWAVVKGQQKLPVRQLIAVALTRGEQADFTADVGEQRGKAQLLIQITAMKGGAGTAAPAGAACADRLPPGKTRQSACN